MCEGSVHTTPLARGRLQTGCPTPTALTPAVRRHVCSQSHLRPPPVTSSPCIHLVVARRRRAGPLRGRAAHRRPRGCPYVRHSGGLRVASRHPPQSTPCPLPVHHRHSRAAIPDPARAWVLTTPYMGAGSRPPVRCVHGRAPGELESGVRTAVALLLRKLQHSKQYRSPQERLAAYTSHLVGAPHRRDAQKIIGQQLAASARCSFASAPLTPKATPSSIANARRSRCLLYAVLLAHVVWCAGSKLGLWHLSFRWLGPLGSESATGGYATQLLNELLACSCSKSPHHSGIWYMNLTHLGSAWAHTTAR